MFACLQVEQCRWTQQVIHPLQNFFSKYIVDNSWFTLTFFCLAWHRHICEIQIFTQSMHSISKDHYGDYIRFRNNQTRWEIQSSFWIMLMCDMLWRSGQEGSQEECFFGYWFLTGLCCLCNIEGGNCLCVVTANCDGLTKSLFWVCSAKTVRQWYGFQV